MEKIVLTLDQLKNLMSICMKFGAENPELAKMPNEKIKSIVTGMINEALDINKNENEN